MRNTSLKDILLSAYGASVGNVDSNLRELSVDIEEESREIIIHVLYALSPSEEQKDLIETMASEMCAKLFPPYNVVANIRYSDATIRPVLPGRTIFSRYKSR